MGWSSGSSLFGDLINTLMKNVPDDDVREAIYSDMIDAFRDADWDNLDECLGEDPVYDSLFKDIYPDSDSEELDFEDDD